MTLGPAGTPVGTAYSSNVDRPVSSGRGEEAELRDLAADMGRTGNLRRKGFQRWPDCPEKWESPGQKLWLPPRRPAQRRTPASIHFARERVLRCNRSGSAGDGAWGKKWSCSREARPLRRASARASRRWAKATPPVRLRLRVCGKPLSISESPLRVCGNSLLRWVRRGKRL